MKGSFLFSLCCIFVFSCLFSQKVFSAEVSCENRLAQEFTKIDTEWIKALETLSRQRQPTSTLIQYGVQNYRTYMCQLDAVCFVLENSLSAELKNPIPIRLFGCKEQSISPYPECITKTPIPYTAWLDFCQKKISAKKAEEKEFLKTVFHRDSARKKTGFLFIRYETLLQKIDGLLYEHMKTMFGYFSKFASKIPCVIKQCD